MTRLTGRQFIEALIVIVGFLAAESRGVELKILLPQGRTAFQTNEWIDVSVVRQFARDAGRRAAGADPDRPGRQPRVGHVRRSRPCRFTAARPAARNTCTSTAGCCGPACTRGSGAAIQATAPRRTSNVFSHVRQSSFRLINWGRAKGKEQLLQGEDSLGFNLFYGHYAADDDANFIRAGVDFMASCVMSGGHQMDLRSECDWSDPYVTRGGTMRASSGGP